MALAAGLIPGFKYVVKNGVFEDQVVTIVDNTPFPDNDPDGRQRKITCRNPEGKIVYFLPRQLTDQPVLDNLMDSVSASFLPPPAINDHVEAIAMADAASVLPAVPTVVRDANNKVSVQNVRIHNPITDPMDPRLDHLRPSRAEVRRYINREMPNGMSDVEFLLSFTDDHYRASNGGRPANLMLKGDTQSGKTFLVAVLAVAWAEKLGLPKPMPVYTISGSSGVTDFDLFGQTQSFTNPHTGQDSLVWLPGMVELGCQGGGILYLDEIPAMGERVTSSLHPVTDRRHHFVNRNKAVLKGGMIMPDIQSAHLDLWIIGTGNENYKGMGSMNEAFINRFKHILWGYDQTVETKLISSVAIRHLGESLRHARDKNTIKTPCGTHALEECERDIAAFGPVMGLNILVGMFEPKERPIVESIIDDRSIILMLNEEAKQAKQEEAEEAKRLAGKP